MPGMQGAAIKRRMSKTMSTLPFPAIYFFVDQKMAYPIPRDALLRRPKSELQRLRIFITSMVEPSDRLLTSWVMNIIKSS